MPHPPRPTSLPGEAAPTVGRRTLILQGVVLLLVLVAVNLGARAVLERHPEWDNPTYTAFVAQWQRVVDLEEPVQTWATARSISAPSATRP